MSDLEEKPDFVAQRIAALQHDPDMWVRRWAAQALGELADERGAAALIDALDDPKGVVANAAAEALVSCKAAALPALAAAYRVEPSAERRKRLVGFVGDIAYRHRQYDVEDAACVDLLAVALGDSDEDVRSWSASRLGNCNSGRAVELAIAALKDPAASVRSAAAEALGRQQNRLAVAAPLTAMQALKRAGAVLFAALDDPVAAVRHAARDALASYKEWRESYPEVVWLTSTSLQEMQACLPRPVPARKWALLAAACCRRMLPLFKAEGEASPLALGDCCRQAVELTERLVDESALGAEATDLVVVLGPCSRAAAARVQAAPSNRSRRGFQAVVAMTEAAGEALACLDVAVDTGGLHPTQRWQEAASHALAAAMNARHAGKNAHAFGKDLRTVEPEAAQADLLRELVGNPFRGIHSEPGWLTWRDGTVVQVARGIVAEQAFDRMRILADALEEAGCGNAVILDHCRGPGPHVLGCWVLDLVPVSSTASHPL